MSANVDGFTLWFTGLSGSGKTTLCNLLSRNGVIAIAAAISPYRAVRDEVRASQDTGRFVEVFLDCPIELLMKRDVKGLYQKALTGTIENFTGVSDPQLLQQAGQAGV